MVDRIDGTRSSAAFFEAQSQRLGAACLCLFAAFFIGGCGGAQKSGKDASGAKAAQRRCLEEAAAPPKASENAPERVAISRILVRDAELDKPHGATRTRGEACVRALEARDELRDGMDWSDMVKAYSDDHTKTDGDLGRVTKKDLSPKLMRAAFALEVKELSYVVETNEGFQIILRTE